MRADDDLDTLWSGVALWIGLVAGFTVGLYANNPHFLNHELAFLRYDLNVPPRLNTYRLGSEKALSGTVSIKRGTIINVVARASDSSLVEIVSEIGRGDFGDTARHIQRFEAARERRAKVTPKLTTPLDWSFGGITR